MLLKTCLKMWCYNAFFVLLLLVLVRIDLDTSRENLYLYLHLLSYLVLRLSRPGYAIPALLHIICMLWCYAGLCYTLFWTHGWINAPIMIVVLWAMYTFQVIHGLFVQYMVFDRYQQIYVQAPVHYGVGLMTLFLVVFIWLSEMPPPGTEDNAIIGLLFLVVYCFVIIPIWLRPWYYWIVCVPILCLRMLLQ